MTIFDKQISKQISKIRKGKMLFPAKGEKSPSAAENAAKSGTDWLALKTAEHDVNKHTAINIGAMAMCLCGAAALAVAEASLMGGTAASNNLHGVLTVAEMLVGAMAAVAGGSLYIAWTETTDKARHNYNKLKCKIISEYGSLKNARERE